VTAPEHAALAADIAGIRELVAGVAAEAARVAAEVERFAGATEVAGLIIDAVRLGYDQGHEDGRAERDPYAAEARARKARAQFKVLPGGKATEARKGTAKAAPRKQSGGAA
jgi:hypothetical protein